MNECIHTCISILVKDINSISFSCLFCFGLWVFCFDKFDEILGNAAFIFCSIVIGLSKGYILL